MSIDDDAEKGDADEAPKETSLQSSESDESESHVELSRIGIEQEDTEWPASSRAISVLEVMHSGQVAKLEVTYTWTAAGTVFNCSGVQYWVTANGRHEGDVRLGFSSVGSWYRELTTNARQDGVWHFLSSTPTGGAVEANASKATIEFSYVFDRKGGDPTAWTSMDVHYAPPPVIESPSGDIDTLPLTVTGRGGIYGRGSITVHKVSDNGLLRQADIRLDGSWTATFDMPSGLETLSFYAVQQVMGFTSPHSNRMTVSLAGTTLTTPASNAVVRADQLVFKGAGFSGARVWVVVPNVGTVLSETVSVTEDKTWEARAVPLNNGSYTAQAAYQIGNGPVKYTVEHRPFTVLAKPVITAPSGNQNMSFTLSGTNALAGATVRVKIDFDNVVVGTTTAVANGSWSAAVQMPKAGPTSLVAEQVYQNVPSQRSDARAVKIKPPKLTNIQVTYPSPGTAKFSGTGHVGATVDVHKTGVNDPQVSTGVSGGQWAVEWSDQPPGSYSVDIRQKLPDGSAWIHSDWSDRLTVTIPVPMPTLEVQIGGDRKPVFAGIGHSWTGQPAAQIEVLRVGESTPAVPIVDVANNRWSSAADEAWNPGSYSVEARQLFNNLSSEPTSRQFVIRAPVPTVEVRQDGLTPRFSGTCLNGAQVQLQFDGDPNSPYAAQVSGATWSFTRTEPFMPGTYTARVTQSFGGQTSDEVSQPFEVVVLRPVITSPVNDEEVDHNPIIQGSGGIPGALMRVFDFVSETLLGEAEVTDNEWSVPLTEDLAFGDQKVYAVQQYGESPSEKSEPVSFKVILFPPTIDHPQPGDAIARVSVIDGYARKVSGLDTATVELWLDGADEPLARVRARGNDGYWFYDAHLPVGTYTLR
ncbi:hypothetical protein, partial [Pseudomonas sp. PSB18]|uniref:hypothetical protein n=1 Tax=Pseudomonas sp. PSB18 TaxID=527802 RepID=UPI001660332A